MKSPGIKNQAAQVVADAIINNALYIIIAVLVIYCAIRYHLFLKNAPIDLLKRTAAYVIMALGMGGVIVMGGADLSAGRVMGLMAIISSILLSHPCYPNPVVPHPFPIGVVFLILVVLGGIIGLFNGFFVTRFKLHPYIVTLATQMMAYGVMLTCLDLSSGRSSVSVSLLISPYKNLIAGNLVKFDSWLIPNYVWLSVLLVIITWFVWNKTALGRNMFAVGVNSEAARVSGVDVFRTILFVFMYAGILYGVNGFVEAARVGGPGGSTGNGAECDAIASCVMGGVSLTGGMGKVGGIVLGVVLLQLVSVCLQWMSVPANYVNIIKGAIILMAVSLDMRKHRAKS